MNQPKYRARHFLMCPPEHFAVEYVINPWMNLEVVVDRRRALRQWEGLVRRYRSLGHTVDLLEPHAGLPDMVFAANGATVVGSRVLGAQFANPQRAAEAEHHDAWHRARAGELGWQEVPRPEHINEAEGDFAMVGDVILGGYGYRTDPRGHAELAEATGMPVIGLKLVDPRFYHLDVALTVLSDSVEAPEIAWYPAAFSTASQQIVRRLFPGALEVSERDALVLALNSVSDGHHVLVPTGAQRYSAELAARGYQVISIELDELLKGGGSIKCCTQELRGALPVAA